MGTWETLRKCLLESLKRREQGSETLVSIKYVF
jgi:hypothetical protein